MKKALYTFLLWDLFLFATGLNDLVFYRNVTLSESATVVDWAQPAFASVTLFLILLSIYYGLHQLLFGKNFYLKLEEFHLTSFRKIRIVAAPLEYVAEIRRG